MYIVLLTYTKPLDEIDYVLPDHLDWLNRQYDAGHFLASGRQQPRVGGVILARTMPRGKLDALLATDPFAIRHMARYDVVSFQVTMTAPELARVNEMLAAS